MKTHGKRHTREYRIWINMRVRCYSVKAKDYPYYGGRGITVCDEWRNSFEKFWEDMEEGYTPEMTIERKDLNGHYNKDNCCWIPKCQQSNHRRTSVYIETPEGTMTLADASRRFKISEELLRYRMKHNCPKERMFVRPTLRSLPTP